MTLDEAKAAVGSMVLSRDPGFKLIPSVSTPHGPYLLKQVTKGGRAIIEKPEGYKSVAPSLLSAPNNPSP